MLAQSRTDHQLAGAAPTKPSEGEDLLRHGLQRLHVIHRLEADSLLGHAKHHTAGFILCQGAATGSYNFV